jgi:hypothetical protein
LWADGRGGPFACCIFLRRWANFVAGFRGPPRRSDFGRRASTAPQNLFVDLPKFFMSLPPPLARFDPPRIAMLNFSALLKANSPPDRRVLQ